MRGKKLDLCGEVFGRLTVIERAEKDRSLKNRGSRWLCKCECGKITIARLDGLRSGHVKSCGCLSRDTAIKTHTKHGMASGGKLSREYTAWVNMKRRCSDDTSRNWKNYGGRGITVCERWKNSFTSFFDDMGYSPGKGYELDRKNNDGNYEPGNCRWVTKKENNANKRCRAEISK